MNYIVLSELGQGGMASVWLAKHKTLDAEFAIKILDKRFISDDNIRKRFLAEARIMSKMNHPNIVRVTDLIDESDTVAFVMEHVPGCTLRGFIEQKGKPSDATIKSLFSQILSATKFIHEQGLIHRDIKPSNFMVTPDNQVKLMDFGIAKIADVNAVEYTGTGASQQMGTPMYMSPEQVRASGAVTAASDIYSLGVTLWHVITGTKPYDTGSLSLPEIQVSILRDSLPLTGTKWDGVIQKATKKNPAERFQSDAEFLNGILNPESVVIEPNVEPQLANSTIAQNPPQSQPPLHHLSPERPKASSKILPIVISVMIFVSLVGAGAYFFLSSSGKSDFDASESVGAVSSYRCSNPNCVNADIVTGPGTCIDCGLELSPVPNDPTIQSPEEAAIPETPTAVEPAPAAVEVAAAADSAPVYVDQSTVDYQAKLVEAEARAQKRKEREERRKAQQQGNMVKCSYSGCSNMTSPTNLIYDSPYKPFCSERCRQRFIN